MSTESATTGYRVVVSSTTIGPDSVEVVDLDNDVRHWFRIVSYGDADSLAGMSRVLETIPGPTPTPEVVIPAFQRDYGTRSLAWSPRGDVLAFVRSEGCVRPNLHFYDLATGQITPVTDFRIDDQYLSHSSWSPDGSMLTFRYSALAARIWVLPVAVGVPRSMSSGPADTDPAWATQETLVFVRHNDSQRSPEIQRLTLGAEPLRTPLTADGRIWKYDLAVSRDGATIAYSGHELGSEVGRCLYTLPVQGGASQMLTVSGWWDDVHPAWHPDGTTIFFASNRCGHFEIWSLGLQTHELRQITRSQRRSEEEYRSEEHYDPALSADGSRLAVLAWRGNAVTIEILALAASEP